METTVNFVKHCGCVERVFFFFFLKCVLMRGEIWDMYNLLQKILAVNKSDSLIKYGRMLGIGSSWWVKVGSLCYTFCFSICAKFCLKKKGLELHSIFCGICLLPGPPQTEFWVPPSKVLRQLNDTSLLRDVPENDSHPLWGQGWGNWKMDICATLSLSFSSAKPRSRGLTYIFKCLKSWPSPSGTREVGCGISNSVCNPREAGSPSIEG